MNFDGRMGGDPIDDPTEPAMPATPPVMPDDPPGGEGGAAPPTVTIESGGEVHRRGIGGRAVAAVVGVLMLAGGLTFAATQLGSANDRTPEEAVEEFFAALADEDVLGVLATLDPGERDALAGPVEDLFEELRRLEVLDDSFDAGGVAGIDLRFDGLAFHTEPVREGLVRVHLVGGTASFAVDTDELPIGDFLTDTFERFGVDAGGIQQSDTATIGEGLDEFLAVRQGPEGWRVSLGYTAAEAARIDAGMPAPNPALALTAVGEDSPEAAVEGLVRTAALLDLPGVVARLSPNELRALHEYWPLVAPAADMVDPGALGLDIDVRSIDLRSETDGDTARVYVDGFSLAVAFEGEAIDMTYADGCLTYAGGSAELGLPTEPVCPGDLDTAFEEAFAYGGFSDMGVEVPTFDPVRTVEGYVVVHRIDGQWYVAPVSTGLHAMVEFLRAIDRSHLDAFVDLGESFVSAFTGGFAFGPGSFEEFEAAPGEGVIEFDSGAGESFAEPAEPIGGADFDPLADFPRPGVSDESPAPEIWDALVAEVSVRLPDAKSADCVLGGLQAEATTTQLYELHDWLVEGFEPWPETQALYERTVSACTT